MQINENEYSKIIISESNTEDMKILPLYTSPVKGLQYFVLETSFNNEKILPWFFSNYIQLEWTENWCINFSLLQDFYVGYPFIDKQILTRNSLKGNNIIDFFINNINYNWYTHLILDEFFVPNKLAYQKEHFFHDNMICGYDKTKKNFVVYGYSDNLTLGISYISFEQIEHAYYNLDSLSTFPYDEKMNYENTIFMIRKNENMKYDLNMELISESLLEYIHSFSYAKHFKMFQNLNNGKVYGINVIEKLIMEFERGNTEIIEDIRLLTTIYEHNLIMKMRVEFLMNKNYIAYDEILLQKFEKVFQWASMAKNLQLYYVYGKKQNSSLTKIIVYLKRIQQEQKIIFIELVNVILSREKNNT